MHTRLSTAIMLFLLILLLPACKREADPAPRPTFVPSAATPQQPAGEGRMDIDEFWRLIDESRSPGKELVDGVVGAPGYALQREAVTAAYREHHGGIFDRRQPEPSVKVDGNGDIVTTGNDRVIELLFDRETDDPFQLVPGQEAECLQAQALLVALVARYSEAEIITFIRFAEWNDLRLYRSDVRAAAILCLGSGDPRVFTAFRDWILANGRSACDTALANPDDLASLLNANHRPVNLRFRLVPMLAYRLKTGQLPPPGPEALPPEPVGDPIATADFAKRFPKLWARKHR